MAMPASNRIPGWDALLTAVHAWHLRPSLVRPPEVRDRWLSQLPVDERSEYDRLQAKGPRENFLAARALCRLTLSRYTGVNPSDWHFGKDVRNKPTLIGPPEFTSLRFNLTHTNDLAICAITRAGDVGVDAEDTSQPIDASLLARHFLSSRQQTRLAALSPRVRVSTFFEQWVLKEAYVKATGEGLATSPERLTVEQSEDGEAISIGRCQFSLWRPTTNHVAAAAILLQYPARGVSFKWFDANALRDLL